MAGVSPATGKLFDLSVHELKPAETQPGFLEHFDPSAEESDIGSVGYDSLDEQSSNPSAKRWDPLGGAASLPRSSSESSVFQDKEDRLVKLEEEQEQLNSSLLSLTTHFAQVQFRLKQIVNADPLDREDLLKELEDFAFRGIPDVRAYNIQDEQLWKETNEREHEEKMSEQREKQRELITQLKSQLEDLETYAYESGGAAELPTNKVIEKQRVLLEELHRKLDLDLENFDKLSTEELKAIVDHAVASIVNPAKVKEKLVDQLKTQVVDLERFIQFLQGESDSPGPYGQYRCTCPVHYKGGSDECDGPDHSRSRSRHKGKEATKKSKDPESTATAVMKKALTILQIYVMAQLGCSSQEFQQRVVKKTSMGSHWGDLRASLEAAITHTLELAQQQQQQLKDRQEDSGSEGDSDSDETEQMSSPALTHCVRKELATAIRDLMQHGLMEAWTHTLHVGRGSSIVPFGCFSSRSGNISRGMHAWDLLVKFYDMKHGREYNESPAWKLSQSFHLDIVGGKPITAKQTLLGAIDTVLKSHVPHKRGEDAYFKAFVCLALNEQKLVTWLRLLFRTQTLVDQFYQDWSYVARTGFEDALQSLDRLLAISFNLPVDWATRSISNIRDAF